MHVVLTNQITGICMLTMRVHVNTFHYHLIFILNWEPEINLKPK